MQLAADLNLHKSKINKTNTDYKFGIYFTITFFFKLLKMSNVISESFFVFKNIFKILMLKKYYLY